MLVLDRLSINPEVYRRCGLDVREAVRQDSNEHRESGRPQERGAFWGQRHTVQRRVQLAVAGTISTGDAP